MNLRKIMAGLILISLVASGWAQQKEDEQVEPKFVWGVLIKFVISQFASSAFDTFTKWLSNRLSSGLDSSIDRFTANRLAGSGAKIGARGTGAATPGASVPGSPPEVVVGNPTTPLKVENGQANYQAVHIALMVAQDDGQRFAYRPVNQGFKTGERFKLRVISTFGGELSLENINPRGERKQIYPARADEVVTLLPGTETLLPLGRNEYFEFTQTTGREQLVINVADPRAVGAAASRHRVYRQDANYGSNFVQEVSTATYPLISQSVDITHSAP